MVETDTPSATNDRDPNSAITRWLDALDRALSQHKIADAIDLFDDTCFWRDFVSFTWNIKTVEGRDAIALMLGSTLNGTVPVKWSIRGEAWNSGEYVEAFIRFQTSVGEGRGHLRLVDGKCRSILTTLESLSGHEEKSGRNRIAGTDHVVERGRENWLENKTRVEARLGVEEQPWCLIIGGGQGGIALAARLRRLGVSYLVIEKNARAGDSWRNRYRSLVLHDPVWYDHLPYLPFPDDWPVFTPKDKMGDWLEAYVKIMELHYWTNCECMSAKYDDHTKTWTVHVTRDRKPVTLKPAQLVFATGAYGAPKMADIPEGQTFSGEVIHTSQYRSGRDYAGKKCAVIGSASSAHDVAADLWEGGADVTMVQRSPSIVVRSETLMKLGFEGLYSESAVENGLDVDRADMLSASIPYRMIPEVQRPIYEAIAEVDAPFYRKLTDVGFLWDFGEDNSGLMAKAMRTASGYYIDVGASALIADGRIKIKSGTAIEAVVQDGLAMSDGAFIAADVIIHATGFKSLDDTIARLISREVSERVGKFWGYGSGVSGDPGPYEGELRNMWKPTAQEALWFHGGNLALSRQFSKYLALQLKARYQDLKTPVYQ